ncbi:hypothetical protein [Nocardia bovistercoris]|uniref:Cardiolipin synthase N-terminal domain-containing protein n=1 Tax=Nocardia bovistercoris TaxID=2785916 RepID=A0A931N3G2_9NOCA|nr:hypothetical protein [Nocardia bovistercoris]MBH0777829.1 hypothetical protein [Nocardia bovistercoris]
MNFSDYLWIVLTIFSVAAYSVGLVSIILRLLADGATPLWSKFCWTVFMIAVPLVGVSIFVIARRAAQRPRSTRTGYDLPSTSPLRQPIRYHQRAGDGDFRPITTTPIGPRRVPPEHHRGATNGHAFTPPNPFDGDRSQ